MVLAVLPLLLMQEPDITYQPDLSSRLLKVDGRVFLATPPEVVAELEVSHFEWSHDGRYLFVRGTLPIARWDGWLGAARVPRPATMVCGLWEAKTGKFKEIARLSEPFDNTDLAFAGLNGGAFFLVEKPGAGPTTVYWVNAVPGDPPKRIGLIPSVVIPKPSPVQEAAVFEEVGSKRLWLGYRQELMEGPALPLGSQFSGWDETGAKFAFATLGTPRSTVRRFLDLNLRELGSTDSFNPWKPAEPLPAFAEVVGSEVGGRLVLQGSGRSKTQPLTVIAEAVTYESMSLDHSAVAYSVNGTIYASKIIEVGEAEVSSILATGEAKRLIASAEAVQGIIFNLYAELGQKSPSSEDVVLQLGQMLKGPEIVAALTLSLKPESKLGVEPVVEIGHVTGKTGRAILYSNGSVKWKKGSR